MDHVYDIIKQAGRIPLNELALRSSESAEDVNKAVRLLVERGLVRVSGKLPVGAADAPLAGDTVIEVTRFRAPA